MGNIRAGMTWEKAMKTFEVSRRTLYHWHLMLKKRRTLVDMPRGTYKVRKIHSDQLLKAIESNPDATLKERAAEFNCWPHAIHRRLKKLNITRKKNHTLPRAK